MCLMICSMLYVYILKPSLFYLPYANHLSWKTFREMKRQESQLQELSMRNEKMKSKLQHLTEELSQQQEERRRMQAHAEELLEENLTLEMHVRVIREKFSVVREHIVLIMKCIEKENYVNKFLDVLLETVNAATSACVQPQSSANSSSFFAITPPPCLTSPPPLGLPSFIISIPPHNRPLPSQEQVVSTPPETNTNSKIWISGDFMHVWFSTYNCVCLTLNPIYSAIESNVGFRRSSRAFPGIVLRPFFR